MTDEFWIGDRVKNLINGQIGVYHSDLDQTKAEIKVGNDILVVKKSDLEIVEDEKLTVAERLGLTPKTTKTKNAQMLPDLIDLHAEVLDPNHQIAAVRLLEFQVSSCKSYLQQAHHQKKRIVTIIHGKGQGVLKEALSHLYHDLGFIRFQIEKHKGGATELWLDV